MRTRAALLLIAGLAPAWFAAAQENPMVNQRWNIFDYNLVRTQFNNTGLLCDGNQQNMPLARPPAFEYPNGSGIQYGTSVGVVLGAPADQLPGAVGGDNADQKPYLDGTMDEGSAAFWSEEHFAPYPFLGTVERTPMSDDVESWPDPWPDVLPGSGRPLAVGSEGWPGFGPGGEKVAEVESFTAMYGWKGTDAQESGATENVHWLNTELTCRGLAWSGSLYEDFIVWVYTVENIGTDPIQDLRVGVHVDFGFFPEFFAAPFYDEDRHYYDPQLQLAYGWDDNSFEILPSGGTVGGEEIAWGGAIALRMPGGDHRVHTYDVFHFWQNATTPRGNGASQELYYLYNLVNDQDPQDSDGDGIDDDFDEDGVPDVENGGPGYWVASGADGVQVMGSEPFDLAPGEIDTLIFATVFGINKADLITNARRALNLYENGWQPLTPPPAPTLEAVVADRAVTLYWSDDAEEDEEFEGYKLYRSADNGVTWGDRSFNDFSGGVHYVPMARFDLDDGIKGNYRTLAEYAWFDLGDDTGLPAKQAVTAEMGLSSFPVGDSVYAFTDRDIMNGLKYRYYVAAYDSGNGVVGPLENTPATNPAEVNNTVEVVPHAAAAATASDLDEVRVVPNPYIVSNAWEQGRSREIQFTRLPGRATVRIFNSAGELVRTLEHDAAGAKAESIRTWDLLNDDHQLVGPGVYFYHITSPVGETSGKFVIIL